MLLGSSFKDSHFLKTVVHGYAFCDGAGFDGRLRYSFSSEDESDRIVDAVNYFNIEDMVNMAESLVSVTNLQRHISSSEESVGGPIDVAVITRSEGFIWVKHKHWMPGGE